MTRQPPIIVQFVYSFIHSNESTVTVTRSGRLYLSLVTDIVIVL